MMIPYFIWNGVNSIEKKIIVNELPPTTRAAKRIIENEIPGRSGKVFFDDNTYDTFVYQIACTLAPGFDVRDVSNWLSGTGKLTISLEPGKFYEGIIINQIDFKKVMHVFREFAIEFELQPFAYSVDEMEHNFIVPGTIYITQSTTDILPYIKVEGNGAVTISINNKSQIINDIDGYIELNSQLEEAYKDNVSKNSNVNGEFLKLNIGENNISWTGNVTNVKIKYRETYL